jgi:hypothetical protein
MLHARAHFGQDGKELSSNSFYADNEQELQDKLQGYIKDWEEKNRQWGSNVKLMRLERDY